MCWGMLRLPNKPAEYSLYATEGYRRAPGARIRRFTYRVDGFVSVSACPEGGELLTKPLVFSGSQLVINALTRDNGAVQSELLDDRGLVIPGFGRNDCIPFRGDNIEHVLRWKEGAELSSLAGNPVQLRFVLQNADLYSFRFR